MLPCMVCAQVAILQIQVVEGEGAVHPPGSRSARPLTVVITDEAGQPVEHAAVSFHLPEDGPGGAFLSGLRTEVAVTDSAGRVSIRGVQWNQASGRFQIGIFASREQARAGTVSFQYIGEAGGRARAVPGTPGTNPAPAQKPPAPGASASHPHSKWIVVATLLAAGATVGVVNGSRSKSAAPSPAIAPSPAVALTIGTPTITVGKP
jgi:hypothetical protein